MESGVATWNKCYKNWRVFSPCSAQTSGGRTEPGYLHSVPARPNREASGEGGSSAGFNSVPSLPAEAHRVGWCA